MIGSHRVWRAKLPSPIATRMRDFYGYMWYTKAEPVGDHQVEVHFASGNGGNKIYVVPSFHMVVAITSSAYGHGYGQRRLSGHSAKDSRGHTLQMIV
jgi:CubicO group peptidase (beta-lactamase class C family)